MTNFEIYALILAIIVFVLLTVLSITCIAYIFKMQSRLIKVGAEDEKLIKEYEKNKNKKTSVFGKVVNYTLTYLMLAIFVVVFSGSIYINCTQNAYFENVPTYRVVKTSSMAKKNEKNEYLFTNKLDNQIQAFDLILTYKVPKEEDLKLYDVVVYETDGMLIVHRIVGIEEPNEKHPNARWFLLQGDAVSAADRFPVTYEQIQGIYKSEKVPFIGSFILFMQSPAGWLCILLVAGVVIITPIIEKKMQKAKSARLLILFPPEKPEEETVVTEVIKKANSVFDNFNSKRDTRTFKEKLESSSKDVKDRYETITETIARIMGARVIEGKKYHTYKTGNLPILRLSIRGKTLNAHLGLNPNEYIDSKYIFTDDSGVKAHQNYPMRLKLTSTRQTKWASELIETLCAKNDVALLEKPVAIIKETKPSDAKWFDGLGENRDTRTFLEKIESLPLAKERYNAILDTISRIDGVRVIDSKKQQIYKKGNTPIAKFMIKGKTLNAYLGLNPKDYENTKYIFADASSVKSHQNYAMRVKVTSSRQVKWTNELLLDLVSKNGLVLSEKPKDKQAWFLGLKKKKSLTFIGKLRKANPEVKERLKTLETELLSVKGVRIIESKKSRTYKVGNKPIVKFMIKGKTLNAYLGLNPKDYENSKYIFTDVSSVKAHQNYGMRVKLTSSRQVKWTLELINAILGEVKL